MIGIQRADRTREKHYQDYTYIIWGSVSQCVYAAVQMEQKKKYHYPKHILNEWLTRSC
jgi:hypothetical protein